MTEGVRVEQSQPHGSHVEKSHAQFVGSIPQHYDRHLGPVLFEPYARDLARRLEGPSPKRILELACGTGILTRELRSRLPKASIIATDLNEAMIEYALTRPDAASGITWRAADMSALPLPDHSFDAVVCQYGVMFVPDKPAAMREAKRVLAPGGTFLFNVWDSLERNRFARITHSVVERLFPADPPSFYRTPFSMHDGVEIRALVEAGGFSAVEIESVSIQSQAPSAAEFARGLVEGNPLFTAIQERGTVPVEKVREEVAQALADELGERPVRVALNAIVVEAHA
jgi:ubiquinone/menaquinone biosynthesis C-methylase UbiE